MYDEIDSDDLSAEEEFELKAAFGEEAVENGDIVRLDTDKLEPVDEPEPPTSFAEVDDVESDARVEEGDTVTVRFVNGNEWTGECTQTTDDSPVYRFRLEGDDPRGEYETICKSFQYKDFITTERGFNVDLVSITN